MQLSHVSRRDAPLARTGLLAVKPCVPGSSTLPVPYIDSSEGSRRAGDGGPGPCRGPGASGGQTGHDTAAAEESLPDWRNPPPDYLTSEKPQNTRRIAAAAAEESDSDVGL